MNPIRLEILSIGTELLIGLQVNRHLTFLGEQLSRHGIVVQRNVVIPDDVEVIEKEFLDAWKRADIVLTTGGLGPTSDDITRPCIANMLGMKMVHDPEIEEQMEAYFRRRERRMPEMNRIIAQRPEGAEILRNRVGTAPGLWIEKEGKLAILLPGPGAELRDVFAEEVLPRLRQRGVLTDIEEYVQLRTAGLGETTLVEKLAPFAEETQDLTIGYCPHEGMVDLRLSAANGDITRERLREIAERFAEHLRGDFVCFGHETLEQVVLELLRKKKVTLSVAESCTGGQLSRRLTEMPGASEVFIGGAVCYSNDSKVQLLSVPECLLKQHGAVSAEVAEAMATRVAERLGSDYALSVTGVAGPSGGTKVHPVGTVYLGLYTPKGVWSRKELFAGGRYSVRKAAVNALIDWLRRELGKSRRQNLEVKRQKEEEILD